MYFHFPTFFRIIGLVFSRRHFTFRRAAITILFIVPFLLLRSVVWIFWKLDDLIYSEYMDQKIRTPIYIIGNPRSGTTFLHRLIAGDDRFVCFNLYQTIFPTIVGRKILSWFRRLDRYLGSPFMRILEWSEKKGFAGWDAIHRTGSSHKESDEMLFMYALLSPLLGLAFPYFARLEDALYADRLPEGQRRRLKAYYLKSLKRHVFAEGPDRILLQKVALIAGRIETILELFPDMKIVYLVRHPYESVPSLISMFRASWRFFDPDAAEHKRASRELGEMILSYYRAIHSIKKSLPGEQFIDIRYEDLVADPKKTVESIYDRFGMQVSEQYGTILARETGKAKEYKSRHRYSMEETGITEEEIYEGLKEIFEEYGFEK